MGVFQRVKCMMRLHHRDSTKISHDALGALTSRCHDCGVQLWRSEGGWTTREPVRIAVPCDNRETLPGLPPHGP
jgi:hypothetical protein